MDLIGRILDKAPGFLKFFKNRWSERRQNKRACALWPELKDYVLDMKHYFESEKTISFCYILQRLGDPTPASEGFKAQADSFRQLHQRSAIFARWYFSVRRELEIDQRKSNAQIFSWKVYTVSSFLSCFGHQLLGDLNYFLQDKTYLISRGLLNEYSTLKDGYNLGLSRYETFLKKCNRDLSSIQTQYFTRLE